MSLVLGIEFVFLAFTGARHQKMSHSGFGLTHQAAAACNEYERQQDDHSRDHIQLYPVLFLNRFAAPLMAVSSNPIATIKNRVANMGMITEAG